MYEPEVKADPVPRGCGKRKAGGVYIECGRGPHGAPIETFLLDPPIPVPEEVDLINKPTLRPRVGPDTQPVVDPDTGQAIVDLWIHIGAEHYPYAPDYIEETRLHGASRKINPHLRLDRLTKHSRMFLAHPKAIALAEHLQPPDHCQLGRVGHDITTLPPSPTPQGDRPFCLFKLWDLLPQDIASEVLAEGNEQQRPWCLRELPGTSTSYDYYPSNEAVDRWRSGFILALPITGIALIRTREGTVNARAKQSILQGINQHGGQAIPFYETNC